MNARMPPMGRVVLVVGLSAAALYLAGRGREALARLGQVGIAASALPGPPVAVLDVSSTPPEVD